jgi:enoyl-CoA hydratase/carnithine racemase
VKKYHLIKTRIEKNVFYLTLNRPEKRNAFTPTMISEIADALQDAQNNPNIWLVVFEAKGSVFCAGMDLKVFQNPDLDVQNEHISPSNLPLGEVIKSINKPTLAIVEGPVIAGGFLIIAECTFVAAHEDATFSLPEVNRGLFPFQVMNSLSKIMPERKILELCILAKTYTVIESESWGLVSHNFEKENFKNEVNSLIDNILSAAPLAVTTGIEVLKKMSSIPENEKHKYLKTEIDKLRNTEDAQEGISAFVEKRKPVWKNK